MVQESFEELSAILRSVGEWWEPNATPQDRRSGYLQIEEDTVELVLSGPGAGSFLDGPNLRSVETFHGFVAGKLLTLLYCTQSAWRVSDNVAFGSAWTATFRCHCAIIAQEHLAPDSTFSSIHFSTNELHKVFFARPVTYVQPRMDLAKIVPSDGASIDSAALEASAAALFETSNLKFFDSNVSEAGLRFHVGFVPQHTFSDVGISFAHKHQITLTPDAPQVRSVLWKQALDVVRLLSLVSVTPNYIQDVRLERVNSTCYLFVAGHIASKPSSRLLNLQVLFGFPRYREMWPSLLDAWFRSGRKHRTARRIFQGTLELDGKFNVNRFLNIMQCLEILSNTYANGSIRPREDYREITDLIKRTLAAAGVGDAERITRAFGSTNRTDLVTRLTELVGRLGEETGSWLFGDVAASIKTLVRARNYFTHYHDAGDQFLEEISSNLGLMTCKLTTLYVLLELEILGGFDNVNLSGGQPWLVQAATRRNFA